MNTINKEAVRITKQISNAEIKHGLGKYDYYKVCYVNNRKRNNYGGGL